MSSIAPTSGESFWRSRVALVTGANGFVGRHVVRALQRRGARVIALVHDVVDDATAQTLERVEVIKGSVLDAGFIERVVRDHDVRDVFHLAARPLVGDAQATDDALAVNIEGTRNVFDAARRTAGRAAVLLVSSDRVYVDTRSVYRDETSIVGRCEPYAMTKTCAEAIARSYFLDGGVPGAVLRLSNVYGPEDTHGTRLVPGTAAAIAAGRRPVISSDGTAERDFVFVEDVADAFVGVARQVEEPGVRGEIFNVGGGAPVSVLTMVRALLRAAAREELEPEVRGQSTPGKEVDRTALDCGKIADRIGWRPATTLDEGMLRTWRWYAAGQTRPSWRISKSYS